MWGIIDHAFNSIIRNTWTKGDEAQAAIRETVNFVNDQMSTVDAEHAFWAWG
jgi:hypothetical protein